MRIGSVSDAYSMYQSNFNIHTEEAAKQAGKSEAEIRQLKRTGSVECSTCANRMYQDGSDEMVSFKSAAHIDPAAAGNKVMAHEMEHVSNAYDEAEQNNGTVISASVQIHTAICPECGRTYVSGGTTTTQIKYNEDPYSQIAKARDGASLIGSRFNASV